MKKIIIIALAIFAISGVALASNAWRSTWTLTSGNTQDIKGLAIDSSGVSIFKFRDSSDGIDTVCFVAYTKNTNQAVATTSIDCK